MQNKLRQIASKSAIAAAVGSMLTATVMLADGNGSGSGSITCPAGTKSCIASASVWTCCLLSQTCTVSAVTIGGIPTTQASCS